MTEYAGWFIDIRAGNALISAFSEQSKSNCRFGCCHRSRRCAHVGTSAKADVTGSSEENLGGQFSTACPLSVVLEPRPHRYGPVKLDFPGMMVVRCRDGTAS